MCDNSDLSTGTHKHKCACGHIWSHSNECAGSKEAHTCPTCGKEEYWKYFGEEPSQGLHPAPAQ